MSRASVLTSLVHFDVPLADLRAALVTFEWDSESIVVLKRDHVVAVLDRYQTGEIDALDVEVRANLVEGRDDINFDADHASAIEAAIYDLGNPVLQGPLQSVAPRVLATLKA